VLVVGRRRVLTLFTAVVPALLGFAARTASATTHLTAGDRRLAALGARLRARDPILAATLAREAEAVLGPPVGRADAARRTRATLLAPARVRADLAEGATALADGWLLARSEAAACVHLSRLASGA
jgi:hypothetical protein